MIGVAIPAVELSLVREFFELWKTPWEPFRAGQSYEVVICTETPPPDLRAGLVIVLGGTRVPYDGSTSIAIIEQRARPKLSHAGRLLPIYGSLATFPDAPPALLIEESSRSAALYARRSNSQTVVRLGYDLFAEVRHLLTAGQPAGHASHPTLDLHIALLRDVVTRAGLPLVEIPPAPSTHKFFVCLTHDIDHPVLRNHRGDHTMFGFLHRATIGSLLSVLRGRRSGGILWKNLWACVRLPFIYLGIARDPWQEFDRYVEIEAGLGATYFVIPRHGYPGRTRNGSAPAARACRYRVEEIAPQLNRAADAGNEVCVHGLDTWLAAEDGRQERDHIKRVIDRAGDGVRMHWLYFDRDSPVALDRAGFTYDSTFGYNETIGFRAGTLQAYRPPGTDRLLELPLHVMDTSLFYPDYLNLTEEEARERVAAVIAAAEEFGGALTINWHDRSIAPERLWDEFYRRLLDELKARSARFSTAAQAVAWFQKRRKATIEILSAATDSVRVRVTQLEPDDHPELKLRIYRPKSRPATEALSSDASLTFVDTPLTQSTELSLAI